VYNKTISGDRLRERSQNPRVVEAGRYLWEITLSSALLTAGSDRAVLRTRSSWVLNISRGRLSLSVKLLPLFDHRHCEGVFS